MAVNRFHVEAWSLPLETTAAIVDRVPFITGSFSDSLAGMGVERGQITVPADWDRLTEVTDPDNDIESLLRVFRDGTLVGSFFGRRLAKDLEDTGRVTITGPGLPSVLSSAEIENFDYPDRPTVDPDWSWGDGATLKGFRNGSFEESELPEDGKVYDVSTYFETQTTQGWDPIPAGGEWVDNTTGPTVDDVAAQSGTYSLTFDPGGSKSGLRKRVVVQGGGAYTWQVYLKATAGSRFLFGVDSPDGATASHTNEWTYNSISYADLANAAKGAGSSTGAWQLTQLAVTMPTFSANPDQNWRYVYLYVVYDDTGTGPADTRIDALTATGPGFGLLPWKKSGPGVTTFTQSTTHVDDGTYSAHLVTTTANDGARQIVRNITIGRTYTFTCRVYHATGSDQEFKIRLRRWKGRGKIAVSTVNVPTATWTTLTVTGVMDQDELLFDVVKTTAGEFWLDTADVYEGQGPDSWGAINIELLDDVTTDHTAEAGQYALDALGFLDYTGFTGTLDSASNAWAPALVEYRAKRGKRYSHIATDGQRQGYEHYITDSVASGPTYDIYNPYDWTTRTGGKGSTKTGVPELRYGAGVTSGPIVKAPAGANRVHIEGQEGQWDVRRDATKISAFGTRMLYEGDVNLLGDDTLGQVADRLLDERTVPVVALKVNIEPGDSSDVATPYEHFNVGDTYPINLTGDFVGSMRVVKITTDFTPGHGRYTTEFDNTSYTSDPQKAVVEAVRRLLDKFDELDAPADESETLPETIETNITDGSTYPTFVVASASAADHVKAGADYVCSGTGDETEIAAAIQQVLDLGTSIGGRVQLSEGDFNISSGATLTIGDSATAKRVHLAGVGYTSRLVGQSASPFTIYMESYGSLSYLQAESVEVTKSGIVSAGVSIDHCRLVGDLANSNYTLITADDSWRVTDTYIYGGLLAALYLGGANGYYSNVASDLSAGTGVIVNGSSNIISGLSVFSPDGEGIDVTANGDENIFTGIGIHDPWTGAGSGAAFTVGGDDNILDGIRVDAAGVGYTYAVDIEATADGTVLGVYNLVAGTSGTINDGGTNTYDYRSPTVAAHTIASHSDTTATGAELETLTDGSNADSLHSHAGAGATDFPNLFLMMGA